MNELCACVDSKLNASKCAFHATFHKVYIEASGNLKFKQKQINFLVIINISFLRFP